MKLIFRKNLMIKLNQEILRFISDKYNILSVIRHVDAVVTAKGTIILEATILGKKSFSL